MSEPTVDLADEVHGESPTRIAECAAILIAMTRMLLDVEPKAFAGWLRAIADDIDRGGLADESARGRRRN